MEYRPVPESRLQAFEAVAHYAFSPEDQPEESDRGADPSKQFGEPRALFEDDELTAICRLLEFEARCRGEWISLGGLRAVATPPEYRRGGRAATLLRQSLAEFAEREIPLVVLWPFDHDFYASTGWASAGKHATYRFPPAALEPIAANETGRLFRPSPDDWERLRRVNQADGEETSLTLHRTENWWRHRVFEQSGTRRHVYAWERDGTVESYVAYTVAGGEDDRTLTVRDVAAVDDRAFRHVCWLLFTHDSQVETVELPGNPGHAPGELLDRVAAPESVTCELDHGAMVRVADVPTALEAIPYPGDVATEFVLDVDDGLVDWNDGSFHVAIEDGDAQCERVEGAREQADVSVSVGTLSQLVVGYGTVGRAQRAGDLMIHGDELEEALGRAFPPRPVELSEFF